MKYLSSLLLLLSCSATDLFAQKQTFDLTTYTPPKGWKKQPAESAVQFTKEDAAKGTYCMITLFKAVPGSANSKENFDMAWASIVKEMVTVSAAPEIQPADTKNGWEVRSGYAAFEKEDTKGAVVLVTASSFEKMVNIVILTNTDAYENNVTAFLNSVSLKKLAAGKQGPANLPAGQTDIKKTENLSIPPAPVSNGFAFTTTNFDDGWVATELADWVEVTKDNIKVLLHYPKEGTIIPADAEPFINNAWNILVAPRYSNLKDYIIARTITEYERGYLAAGTATDIKTGKEVFVTLFRRGSSGFIEFITPDKKTFVDKFGVDLATITWSSDSKIWDPLQKMANYNKFAVAASDLTGIWTSDFSGMQQLYHVYTGQYAGMNIHQSSETFEFGGGNSYSWKILAVNGMVASMKFDHAKSAGKFSVANNWQVYFSMIEGKPKTFNAYFSCIKGARILWLQDAAYPTNYTSYGKK